MTHTPEAPPGILSETVQSQVDRGVFARLKANQNRVKALAVVAPWFWFLVRGTHPWFDLLAITLPVIIGGAALLALHLTVSRRSFTGVLALVSLALFFVAAVVTPMRPTDRPDPADPFRVASVNLGGVWFSDNDLAYLDSRQAPNILVGSELAQSHDQTLRERFPHALSEIIPLEQTQAIRDGLAEQQTDDYRKFGFPSIGIYSDFALARMPDPLPVDIPGGLPGIRAKLDAPTGEVMVYALHVPRPGTGNGVYEVGISEQSKLVDAIVDAIEAETLPVVVVGDLNVVDRSASYRAFRSVLIDAMREERWARATRGRDLEHILLMARVDHILVSESLCVSEAKAESLLFTDHTPIYADIGACEFSS